MMHLKNQTLGYLMGATLMIASLSLPLMGQAEPAEALSPLAGTWTLLAADLLLPDGRRIHDYGDAPKGLLMIDTSGHYAVQIYDSARPKFASGQKDKGTAEEYKAAVRGSSVHFGTISIDKTTRTLTLKLEQSNYPNQEGTVQKRVYELEGDVLSYRVPPRPDGSIPVSVWRRVR